MKIDHFNLCLSAALPIMG